MFTEVPDSNQVCKPQWQPGCDPVTVYVNEMCV